MDFRWTCVYFHICFNVKFKQTFQWQQYNLYILTRRLIPFPMCIEFVRNWCKLFTKLICLCADPTDRFDAFLSSSIVKFKIIKTEDHAYQVVFGIRGLELGLATVWPVQVNYFLTKFSSFVFVSKFAFAWTIIVNKMITNLLNEYPNMLLALISSHYNLVIRWA